MRRALLALLALGSLLGCKNPVIDPYEPDPAPVIITRPSTAPVSYYPENRAYYQFLPDAAAAKAVTLEVIRNADEIVALEMDRLSDPAIIDELRKAAGRGVQVQVMLNDTGADREANQPAVESLQAAGAAAFFPHLSGGAPASFVHQRARVLFSLQKGGASVVMVYSAAMTPEGLASGGPALVDLDDAHSQATSDGMGQVYGNQPPTQLSMEVIQGPGLVRNHVESLVASAKQSITLQCSAVTDEALVRRLGEAAAAGVAVRVLLPAEAAEQLAALRAAGVEDVRLSPRATLPGLMLLDGDKAVVGSWVLTSESLMHNREFGLALKDAKVAAGVAQALASAWEEAR